MRTTHSFSILFWIYTKRAIENQARIYARITVDSKKVNISLNCKADVNAWDSVRQRARGSSNKARMLNHYLDQVHAKLFNCYQDLLLRDQLITVELIKSHYLGEAEESKTLQEIIGYHKIKTENTLARGTQRNFEITEGYINKFLKKKRKTTDVFLRELDFKFLCDFETFLFTYWPEGHFKSMSHNTVMKHIQRFRKIVTLAYHLEWINKDPFIRWKPTWEKKEREFLSEHELLNLETYPFPIERLDRVRDLFVFSCYTGISYIDIMQLTSDNICQGSDGKNWIMFKRQKTETLVNIPILDKAEEVISKYKDHPITQLTGTLLPVITNEKLNLYLKEIADACQIRKNLTFHMARHTFATTVTLSNGVPIETVSKLLGHTKIATTQIYARVIEKKVSEDMELLQYKMNRKKL